MANDDDDDDISPTVDFLKSLRSYTPDYPLLFGEAVDNALDVNASRIEIEIKQDRISITDNGKGILPGKYKALFRLGQHEQRKNLTIGRYGQGIKVQAIRAGAVLRFWTQNDEEQARNTVNWDALIRKGSWKIGKAIRSPVDHNYHTGTAIVIARLDKPAKARDIENSKADISRMFYPVLDECEIILNGDRLMPVAEPKMTDIIETRVEVSKGKGARIRAGILKTPGGWLSQVHLIYKHRVLKPQCSFGCGDYTGLTSMFCRIDLDPDWHLMPFKDGLKDPDDDALRDQIEAVLRPILEKCEAASMDAVADEMADLLTQELPPEMHPVRPRKKGEKRGVGKKKGDKSGGVSRDADSADRGPARASRQPYIKIEFLPLHAEHGIGRFEADRRLSRIQLSKDNPYIAYWLKYRQEQPRLMALRLPALMLYLHHKDAVQGDIEPFGMRVWKLLERQPGFSAMAA